MSPAFRYGNDFDARGWTGSLSDILRLQGQIPAEALIRTGQINARAAEQQGAINARAAEQGGAITANTINNIAQTVGGVALQLTDPRRKIEEVAARRAQDMERGQQQVDTLLKPYTPNGPMADGEARTPQNPYLDAQGLYDIPKLTQALSSSGMAHLAPELLKSSQSINDSILEHQQRQAKLAEADTVLYGDMADGVLKLVKGGVPIDQALDLAAAPALATKRFDPQAYGKVRAQLLSLPPEQQQAALGHLMDAASKVAGVKKLGAGDQDYDRYGRLVAENVKAVIPPQPTQASLAAAAANGDPKAQAALDALQAPAMAGRETAASAQAEAARHNAELEKIGRMSAGRAEASAAETARHNRAMEESARNRVTARPVLSGDANRIADIDTSISQLHQLSGMKTGAGSQIAAEWVPNFVTEWTGVGSDSKGRQALIETVKQIIGKGLEGGVLRKEDEVKYAKILPRIGDAPAVAADKIRQLETTLRTKREQTLETLADAGFNVAAMQAHAPKEEAAAPPGAPAKGTTRSGATWDYRNGQWGWWK